MSTLLNEFFDVEIKNQEACRALIFESENLKIEYDKELKHCVIKTKNAEFRSMPNEIVCGISMGKLESLHWNSDRGHSLAFSV